MLRRNSRGSNQQPQPAQSRNEINYDSAISTLKAMFVTIDESVLRLVLDTNGGRMETTVENLLQMTSSEKQNANHVAAPSRPVPAAVAPPISVRPGPAAIIPKRLPYGANKNHVAPLIDSSNYEQASAVPAVAPTDVAYSPPEAMSISQPPANRPRQISNANHDLPEDFMRPPSYWLGKHKRNVSEQEKEDEKLAHVLQDSLFMAELQKHPEWVLEAQRGANPAASGANDAPQRAAQRSYIGRSGNLNQSRQNVNAGGQAEYTRSVNDPNNTKYDAFKSKISDLGAAAKSRLALLAERFKTNNNQDVSTNYQALSSDQYDQPPRPNQN